MSTQGREIPVGRHKRAPMACRFCRHRKMKCNNEKPACQNCRKHGKSCVYDELVKKQRPSTARISLLEEENRQLQLNLSRFRDGNRIMYHTTQITPSTQISEPAVSPINNSSDNIATRLRSRPLSRTESPHILTPTSFSTDSTTIPRTFSPDNPEKESCYHGPTSTVFDEKSTETEIHQGVTSVTDVSDASFRYQLVAESASQRQLETINFLADKLDFDKIDPELGMHLLSVYWNRQQSSGPIVYRTAFMRDMACAGPYFSKLLLNAIYFYACKYTSRSEVCRIPSDRLTAGWQFRQRFSELLSQTFDNSSIPTIQALLIVSGALFSWCDEKSKSWLYAGMAFNMITDLGIHVNPAIVRRRFSGEDLEIRLRVFWSAYVIDKTQSLYQGRPARLREYSASLPMAFLDQYEELELFSPLSYTELTNFPILPVYSISTFEETCKLSVILDKVLNSLYAEKSGSRDNEYLLQESEKFRRELENWKVSLPPHLRPGTSNSLIKVPLPHTLALSAMFNVLVILLHRPFVTEGHLYSTCPSFSQDAFSACTAAAFEIDHILRAYEQRFSIESTPYIISYATYVSATIHVRLAAQRQIRSNAHEALHRCLRILDIHQSVCYSPRRAKRVIDRLMIRMGVFVDNRGSRLPVHENFELVSSNRSGDTTEHTSSRVRQSAEATILQPPIGSNTVEVANVENYLSNEQVLPFTGDDMGFLYDPIFGIDGFVFDNLDLEYGCGLISDTS